MKKICSGWLFSGFAIFLSLFFMNCDEEYGGVRRNVTPPQPAPPPPPLMPTYHTMHFMCNFFQWNEGSNKPTLYVGLTKEASGGQFIYRFSCNNGVTSLACPQGFHIRSSGIESHARTRAISTIQNQQGYLVQTKDIVEFFFPDDSILSAWLDADCQG